eukprot:CAMPEP_0183437664 /NCGR_PEP_ID=MMETSP0370-20130417/74121_1 /TAXON_ID=268820 /ORGANISM="Peridinium aciculiferum, Strain PAER-2" /LENGTH=91 /DNA_ID=CAMNT_0025625557 /DNA_START=77 /DNA_END=352 /DNA_ORIENTATION=+
MAASPVSGLRTSTCWADAGQSSGEVVAPVEKVLRLLEDLKTKLESEGAAEAMSAELRATEWQYAKEKAGYEASVADLSKAISNLDSAINAM